MNWVDVVLLVAVAAAAVHGLRLGAAVQVLSFGGFILGLFLGAVLAPHVVATIHSQVAKSVVTTVVVFGLAVLLGTAGRVTGARFSVALQRLHLGSIDAAVGVVVGVAATLFTAWLVASLLVSSGFTALAAGIQDSQIVRAIDRVLPRPAPVFARIQALSLIHI